MWTLAGRPLIMSAWNSSFDTSSRLSSVWHKRAPALDRMSARLAPPFAFDALVALPLARADCADCGRRRSGDWFNKLLTTVAAESFAFRCFGELFGLECLDVFADDDSVGSSSMLDVLPGLYFQPQFFHRFFESNLRISFGLKFASLASVAGASVTFASPPVRWICCSSAATKSISRSSTHVRLWFVFESSRLFLRSLLLAAVVVFVCVCHVYVCVCQCGSNSKGLSFPRICIAHTVFKCNNDIFGGHFYYGKVSGFFFVSFWGFFGKNTHKKIEQKIYSNQ